MSFSAEGLDRMTCQRVFRKNLRRAPDVVSLACPERLDAQPRRQHHERQQQRQGQLNSQGQCHDQEPIAHCFDEDLVAQDAHVIVQPDEINRRAQALPVERAVIHRLEDWIDDEGEEEHERWRQEQDDEDQNAPVAQSVFHVLDRADDEVALLIQVGV